MQIIFLLFFRDLCRIKTSLSEVLDSIEDGGIVNWSDQIVVKHMNNKAINCEQLTGWSTVLVTCASTTEVHVHCETFIFVLWKAEQPTPFSFL